MTMGQPTNQPTIPPATNLPTSPTSHVGFTQTNALNQSEHMHNISKPILQ